jgi:hypothetical protein
MRLDAGQGLATALNLNVHFHMLFLDGVDIETEYGKIRFQRAMHWISRNCWSWCIRSASGLLDFLSARATVVCQFSAAVEWVDNHWDKASFVLQEC